MIRTLSHSSATNLSRPSEQSLLPAVRCAVSAVILAITPTGCAGINHPEQVHSATVEIPATPSSASESKIHELIHFSPDRAVKNAILEPLSLFTQMDAEYSGIMAPIHVYKNNKVLVWYFDCQAEERKEEGPCSSYHVLIHSNQGPVIDIRAEVPEGRSIYDNLRGNDFTSFEIKYMDLSVIHANYWPNMSPEAYGKLMERIIATNASDTSKIIPKCVMNSSGFKCENVTHPDMRELEKVNREFWNQPGDDWHSFVANLSKEHVRQSF